MKKKKKNTEETEKFLSSLLLLALLFFTSLISTAMPVFPFSPLLHPHLFSFSFSLSLLLRFAITMEKSTGGKDPRQNMYLLSPVGAEEAPPPVRR